MQGIATLAEMLVYQEEINKLDRERVKKQNDLFDREAEIERQRDALQDDVRKRLEGEINVETIMAVSFEIV
jgi:hypothetical protein